MKIEKLSNNKLKVIFSIKELEKENIDYQAFMAGSEKCENLISNLLYIAKDELDFDTRNCSIEIETFEISHGNFVITITKFETSIQKLKTKRKQGKFLNCTCIYEFCNYDNYSDYMNFLQTNFGNIFKILKNNSKVYNFDKRQILVLDTTCFSKQQAGLFNSTITEFANFRSNSYILATKICELHN